MHAPICDAIAARRRLRFVYEGYERVVEPHVYGVNTQDHEMVSAWLVAGWSASTPEPGWRNYLVGDMADVQVLSTPFEAGARPGYNPDDPAFRQVFCRLEPEADAAAEAPANADDLYSEGRRLLDAGDPGNAVEVLLRSAGREPHFKTLELLAEAYLVLGHPLAAVVPLAASTTLHRGAQAPALLADVFRRLGRWEQAYDLAAEALARDPDHALAREVRDEARTHRPPET